jgi:hypothetical protein
MPFIIVRGEGQKVKASSLCLKNGVGNWMSQSKVCEWVERFRGCGRVLSVMRVLGCHPLQHVLRLISSISESETTEQSTSIKLKLKRTPFMVKKDTKIVFKAQVEAFTLIGSRNLWQLQQMQYVPPTSCYLPQVHTASLPRGPTSTSFLYLSAVLCLTLKSYLNG